MVHRMLFAPVLGTLLVGVATGWWATPSSAAESEASLDQQKREALDWLDDYLSRQVLLTKDYVDKVRAAVAKMSPEETQQWLKQTADMRALLDSREWRETEAWLDGFLSVQTIYSQKEIEELRKKASRMSPEQLLELMKQIREKHLNLQQSRPPAAELETPSPEEQRAAFERRRQAKLQFRDDYQRQMAAQQRAASRSSSPLFGSSQGSVAAQYNAIVNAKIRSVPSPRRAYNRYGRW